MSKLATCKAASESFVYVFHSPVFLDKTAHNLKYTNSMALQVTTDGQAEHIATILKCKDLDFGGLPVDRLQVSEELFISFDQMAEIVDYLRAQVPNKELFEECWVAYKRKGSKKKSLEYWKKLSEREKGGVLAHIKAYVSSREIQYQKDFERYLRDKVFKTVVYADNKVIYDPEKKKKGKKETYMPICDGALCWNEVFGCYIYLGYWDRNEPIADGYDDESRPDGALIKLNNGRGTITWDCETKKWNKI